MVKTLAQALRFVEKVNICTIFSAKAKGIPSLWDSVDLPEGSGGNTKWGAKVEAVWRWKNELPAVYPEKVFYGKIRGGHAALMTVTYLKQEHYAANHCPIEACKPLAREIFEIVRRESPTTAVARKLAIETLGCTKSQFDAALKQLQVTLNIARLNTAWDQKDTWVPFSEMYAEIFRG